MVAMLVRSKDGLGLRRLATYDMTTCFAVHQTEPMEKNRWDTLSFDLPYETHQVIDLFGDTGCGDESLSGYFMIQVITYTFAGFLKWWYP